MAHVALALVLVELARVLEWRQHWARSVSLHTVDLESRCLRKRCASH